MQLKGKGRSVKINEVERLVGISKKNIRFYEKENLLHPQRNLENGYRDYSEKEVEILKRIRLLRRLSIPLEEIRKLLDGEMAMESVLKRHMIVLEEQSDNLLKVQAACAQILEAQEPFWQMDADAWLGKLDQMEKEGIRLMDVKRQDRVQKNRGSLLAAMVFSVLMIAVEALFLWAVWTDPEAAPPFFVLAVFVAVPAVFIAGTMIALVQRLKEIEGGEEDVAAQY